MESIAAGYDGVRLFEGVDLDLRYKERVALVGKNGIGKSTLFKLILGTQEPMDGGFKIGSRVKCGGVLSTGHRV